MPESRILKFFSNQPEYPAILGDMMEEFHQRAALDGERAARRWFAIETLRNAWALTVRELARTPGRTLLLALAGVAAVNFATGAFLLSANLRFPLTTDQAIIGLLIQLIVPLYFGRFAARMMPGREFGLAIAYTGLLACLGFAAFLWALTHDIDFHSFAPYRFLIVTLNTTRVVSFWFGALRTRSLT